MVLFNDIILNNDERAILSAAMRLRNRDGVSRVAYAVPELMATAGAGSGRRQAIDSLEMRGLLLHVSSTSRKLSEDEKGRGGPLYTLPEEGQGLTLIRNMAAKHFESVGLAKDKPSDPEASRLADFILAGVLDCIISPSCADDNAEIIKRREELAKVKEAKARLEAERFLEAAKEVYTAWLQERITYSKEQLAAYESKLNSMSAGDFKTSGFDDFVKDGKAARRVRQIQKQ